MLLIYGDPTTSNPEAETMYKEYLVFTEEIAASGELVAGEPLEFPDTATTVRVRDGKRSTTDGPFAETKEVLGGYYTVDVKDLDRAIELAAKIPGARVGSVEVRPVADLPA
ncbi:MAG TPA: YciI family protein [Acidimicrobiales bacterium]|jgi:hypothetical protein